MMINMLRSNVQGSVSNLYMIQIDLIFIQLRNLGSSLILLQLLLEALLGILKVSQSIINGT